METKERDKWDPLITPVDGFEKPINTCEIRKKSTVGVNLPQKAQPSKSTRSKEINQNGEACPIKKRVIKIFPAFAETHPTLMAQL